jgi:transcriptional regulator with XRE-family HTH domain
MTREEFRTWRQLMGWTQRQCGEQIGISPRTVAAYESGELAVPAWAELATWALLHGTRRQTETGDIVRSPSRRRGRPAA